MPDDQQADAQVRLEERRIALQEEIERERLRLDQQRHELETSFLRAHLGALLTSLISLATVIWSIVQFSIASMESRGQTELQRSQAQAAAQLQENEWRLSVLKYLTDHREEIYSPDPKVRDQVRTVLEATLPHEILVNVLAELHESASDQTASTWSFSTVYQWTEADAGDCDGHDVPPETDGPKPLENRCDASSVDQIAICWDQAPYSNGPDKRCAYKDVKPEECIEGPNPGRMYQCVAEVIRAGK